MKNSYLILILRYYTWIGMSNAWVIWVGIHVQEFYKEMFNWINIKYIYLINNILIRKEKSTKIYLREGRSEKRILIK